MLKIKKDDQVIVIAGKDKGRQGKVLKILDNGRMMVSGINIVKRHTKANPNLGKTGGIIESESSIEGSNIAIYNPATQKADRVGIKILEDGKKVRFFKSNNEVVGG